MTPKIPILQKHYLLINRLFLYRHNTTNDKFGDYYDDLLLNRAAMFTHVNSTVSCFCKKRLLNWPTV